MQLPQKKVVSIVFKLISLKPMSITTLDTHLSNIYNKFMQLPENLVSCHFMLTSWKPMFITTIMTDLSIYQ